jgi:chemotaxis protein MotB
MSQKKQGTVVVRKVKKGGHGGHHGGSWKVAYADFVTAMMAFFMVMWILSMDPATKDLVQGYFNNPVGFKKSYSGGTTPISAGNAPTHVDLKRLAMLVIEHQRRGFEEAATEIREKLSSNPELQRLAGQIEIVITEEGMRLELLEDDEGERFFEVGGATLQPGAARALRVIAQSLASLPNNIVIEGHTDARSYGPSAAYTNWELSADRANAARRQLLAGGVPVSRVVEVRGYADRALRLPSSPYDAANRRVSILLPFNMPMIQEGSMEEAARRVAAGASADDPDVLRIPVDMTDVLGLPIHAEVLE